MKISRFLSTQTATWLVLLVGLSAKTLLIFYYSFVGRDKIYHLSAVNNLLEGKGWNNTFYAVQDLNSEILQPFCHWPPGYGLLMTPLYAIHSDVYFVTIAVEVIFFILLIWVCRRILKTLDVAMPGINIFTLLMCFFPFDFIEESLGTDLPAMVFLLASLYFLIKIFRPGSQGLQLVKSGLLCGFCLFLSGLIRYNYVVVAITLPIILILACYLTRQRQYLRAMFSVAVVSITGSIAMMVFLNTTCGEPLVMVEATRGFYPGNLVNSYPSMIASVINTRLIATTSHRFEFTDYSSMLQILSYCNLAIYAFCIFLLLRWFFTYRNVVLTPYRVFVFAGSVASIAIIATLAYLSLTNELKRSVNGNVWTYIVEGRYYAFVVVFVQLLIFSSFHLTTSKIVKRLLTLCIVLIGLSALHQVYFTGKTAITYREMKSNVAREMDYDWFIKEIRGFSNGNAGVITASTDAFYPLYTSMEGHKGMIDPFILNKKLPQVKVPTVLFIIVHDNELASFDAFLKHKGVTLYNKIGETNIYTLILPVISSAQ